jgi:hypothetical protein
VIHDAQSRYRHGAGNPDLVLPGSPIGVTKNRSETQLACEFVHRYGCFFAGGYRRLTPSVMSRR